MREIDFNKQKRIDYMDLFRGFGVILMIMGHIGYGGGFDFFIHAFHMPMFFWISGYFFKHKSKEEVKLKSIIIKKAKSLLIPYCVFGIGHYCLWLIFNDFSINPLLHLFSVNTYGLPICGALWFLTALFLTDILFFIIDRYIKKFAIKTIVIGIISLLGNTIRLILPYTLPFAMSASFVGIGLYYLGFLTKTYEKNKIIHSLMNLPWISNMVLASITITLIFVNGYINMREGIYSIIPLFWINALLSITVGINFSKSFYLIIKNTCFNCWIVKIGANSIIYVCLNQIIILISKKILEMMLLPNILSKVLIFIITMSALYIANKLIVSTKLRVLIGK